MNNIFEHLLIIPRYSFNYIEGQPFLPSSYPLQKVELMKSSVVVVARISQLRRVEKWRAVRKILWRGAEKTQNIDDICRNTVDICTNSVEICRNIIDILSFLCAWPEEFVRNG